MTHGKNFPYPGRTKSSKKPVVLKTSVFTSSASLLQIRILSLLNARVAHSEQSDLVCRLHSLMIPTFLNHVKCLHRKISEIQKTAYWKFVRTLSVNQSSKSTTSKIILIYLESFATIQERKLNFQQLSRSVSSN